MKIDPDPAIWKRINRAILDENAADVIATMISGMCSILISAGLARDEYHARVHLAAIVVSPSDGKAGQLLPDLMRELEKIKAGP